MTVVSTVITALPTAPDSTTMTPDEFSAAAVAHAAALPTLVSEINTVSGEINSAVSLAQSISNFQGTYSTLAGALSVPASVEKDGVIYMLLQDLADVTTQVPGAAPTYWLAVSLLARSARTSNTPLAASDLGDFIEATSGTFTQTFTAAATLAAGWFCYYKNSGTGDVTLDPNGAETIDGLTSFIMYPGEMRLITCSGTAFFSTVINPFQRAFTASATFTRPPGYQAFEVEAWSGGASGQRTNAAGTLSVGGAGGGYHRTTVLSSVMSATETLVVGSGGTAVSTVAVGNVGGSTTMTKAGAAWLVVTGATHTSGGFIQIFSGGSANTSADSAINFAGGLGSTTGRSSLWGGASPSTDASSNSGSSVNGGGAGGSVNAAGTLRTAGSSQNGGAGGAASAAGNGTDGTAPAGGGGATKTGTTSGAGARGEIRIRGLV